MKATVMIVRRGWTFANRMKPKPPARNFIRFYPTLKNLPVDFLYPDEVYPDEILSNPDELLSGRILSGWNFIRLQFIRMKVYPASVYPDELSIRFFIQFIRFIYFIRMKFIRKKKTLYPNSLPDK